MARSPEEAQHLLQQMFQKWQSKLKYSLHYLGSSHDVVPPADESDPEYFKYLTVWTWETIQRPVSSKVVNVEFTVYNPDYASFQDTITFRIEHELFVYRIPSNHAFGDNIDNLLAQIFSFKRTISQRWTLPSHQHPFLLSRINPTEIVQDGVEKAFIDNLMTHKSRPNSSSRPGSQGSNRSRPASSSYSSMVALVALAGSSSQRGEAVATDHQAQWAEPVQHHDDTGAIESYLVDMFVQADVDQSGYLNAQEFRQLLLNSSLRLEPSDIAVLHAAADEDEDGKIAYQEFVPIGVDLIHSLRARKHAYRAAEKQKQLADQEAYAILHGLSPEELQNMVDSAFHEFDRDRSGTLSRPELRELLRSLRVDLTKSEVNAILARVNPEEDGQISIELFRQEFPSILQDILASSILTENASELEVYLLNEFRHADPDQLNALPPAVVRDVLSRLPKVSLSKMQVYVIMAEAPQDEQGYIEYVPFTQTAAHMIMEMFDPHNLQLRHDLMFRSGITPIHLLQGKDRTQIEEALRQKFFEADVNEDGSLSFLEFRRCLESTHVGLTPKQLNALMNMADVDANGNVNLEEFIQLAYDILLSIAREAALTQLKQEREENGEPYVENEYVEGGEPYDGNPAYEYAPPEDENYE